MVLIRYELQEMSERFLEMCTVGNNCFKYFSRVYFNNSPAKGM